MKTKNNDYGDLYVPDKVSLADLVQAYAEGYIKSYEEQFAFGQCTREQKERACAAVNSLVGREFGGILADQVADAKRTDGGKTLWSVPCPECGKIVVESWGDGNDYTGVIVAYQAENGERTSLAICEKESQEFAQGKDSQVAVFTCNGVDEEPVRTDVYVADQPARDETYEEGDGQVRYLELEDEGDVVELLPRDVCTYVARVKGDGFEETPYIEAESGRELLVSGNVAGLYPNVVKSWADDAGDLHIALGTDETGDEVQKMAEVVVRRDFMKNPDLPAWTRFQAAYSAVTNNVLSCLSDEYSPAPAAFNSLAWARFADADCNRKGTHRS